MQSKTFLMLRSAACPEEPPAGGVSKGARLEARTAATQPIS